MPRLQFPKGASNLLKGRRNLKKWKVVDYNQHNLEENRIKLEPSKTLRGKSTNLQTSCVKLMMIGGGDGVKL